MTGGAGLGKGMDAAGAAGVEAELRPSVSSRQIAAVVAGNALEFYDFLTYAYFAAEIGRAFFPSADAASSLLASLATFGVGFGMRPVGAWVIGRFGDRFGRKPAMLVSFSLMGLGMTGLALTPSYASIGVAAPALAVAWRLIQGFALGGEVGPSTAFLAEAASPGRRGFHVSFQLASQRMASLAAGLIGILLSSRLSAGALDAWGWRAAFLVGAVIIPVGLILRGGLVETLSLSPEAEPEPPPGRTALIAALALIMLSGGTISSYVTDYLTTYAKTTLHMASRVAFFAPAASGLAGVVFAPLGGWLSDRIGRKPVMLGSWALALAGVMPMFLLLDHNRSALDLVLLSAGLTAVTVMMASAALAAIGEGLPMRIRSGALGLIYALAISAFGGTAQFVVAWLTHLTGSPLAPAWYLTGAVAISLLAVLAMPETAPGRASSARIAA
jgi:MFS family permease